ncbi:MAG: DUF6686 family protein [Bacteroidota bacterium]
MDKKHDWEVLHSSKFGFLVYCKCCQHFQLGFGTFKLTHNLRQLESFSDLINRHAHSHHHRLSCKRRDIFIESPHPGFGLLLAPAEVVKLNDILQKALLIFKARDPIRLQ